MSPLWGLHAELFQHCRAGPLIPEGDDPLPGRERPSILSEVAEWARSLRVPENKEAGQYEDRVASVTQLGTA